MATIRVRDWTKARLEEIQAAESHSSHDSVIKTLLKDRELAAYADAEPASSTEPAAASVLPGEPAFDDLTVLGELRQVDNGVLFLWCPSCGNEIAHLAVEGAFPIEVFEIECQRCLAQLDHHAIVGIEIGYPLEERLVEGTVEADLRACVVDYWDRALEGLGAGAGHADGTSADRLVWQLGGYLEEFGWDWPADVPAVGLRPGETYRDEVTGERLAVDDRVVDGATHAYAVRWLDGSGTEPDRLSAGAAAERLLARTLYVET